MLGAIALAGGGAIWKRRSLIADRLSGRARAHRAAWLEYELELLASYATHLRDVMETFTRARGEAPDAVRQRIRLEVMEPIRDFLVTGPGEQLKIVWFQPDLEGRNLLMREQVGHTEEGQREMRLPIGVGIAGQTFSNDETIYVPVCRYDPRFKALPEGKAEGSLLCVPIRRERAVVGVLSVLSSCDDAFWVTERIYFEGLAAAIGALEPLGEEEESLIADHDS